MKTLKLKSKMSFLLTLCALLMLGSCNKMSEQIKVESAGINGGFEVSKKRPNINGYRNKDNCSSKSKGC